MYINLQEGGIYLYPCKRLDQRCMFSFHLRLEDTERNIVLLPKTNTTCSKNQFDRIVKELIIVI